MLLRYDVRDDSDLSFGVCFRLHVDTKNVAHSCGFASEQDATGSDLELWMPQTDDTAMAVDTAKYIVSHVGAGFCELIEQEKSAMSWMNPGGMLVSLHTGLFHVMLMDS